jgi:hypothetical protein
MKIAKWILFSVLGLIGVLIIGVVIVFARLDSIVRNQVQTQATNSLGVQTTLGGADVSIFGGSLSLKDLEIASPPGFSAPKMFTLGGTSVDVSVGQLRKDPIHVDSITIQKPTLVVEQSGGKFNFKALMDQMPTKPDEPAQPDKEPIKLIIDKLTVDGGQVVVRPGLNLPNIPQEITVPLPAIAMEQVGTGEGNKNGAALKDVIMQVVTTMAAKASESDKLPPELRQLLSMDVNAVAEHLTGQVKQQIQQQVNKAIGEATKNLPASLQGAATQITKDPNQLLKDPGKAIQQNLPGNVGGLLGGNNNNKKPPATKP